MDTVSAALEKSGLGSTKTVERWYKEMPREEEMLPKDKYTIFDRKEKRYRKGIHSESTSSHRSSGTKFHLQNFPSGQESASESIRQVSDPSKEALCYLKETRPRETATSTERGANLSIPLSRGA